MKRYQYITLFTVISALIAMFSGCGYMGGRITAEPIYAEPYIQDSSTANRYTDSSSEQTTVVESAMEVSQKYAELSEEASRLRQKNQLLTEENKNLKEKAKELQQQLGQTQKELTEANNLLIDMRVELNNWKTNVLGFRDELRQADSEQLKALIKIIEILGGKIQTQTSDENGSQQTPVGMNMGTEKINENIDS